MEACKSYNHTLRYTISTEQMYDLNTLTFQKSTELIIELHETQKYSKSPQKNKLSQKNTRKIRA